MNKPLLLVVEDDAAVRSLISITLKIEDYKFHTAETGQQAVIEAVSQKPDIMILDLGLPDIDGIEIIKKIRSWSKMPIIVVSARSDDKDKIEALDNGADDYITKPFSVEELLARIRAALRRATYMMSEKNKGAVFINGGLKIDYAAGCVYIDGLEVHLMPMEYKLLCLLANNLGKVLTYKYITRSIWGNAWDNNVASLRVYMATLRKKIEKDAAVPEYIQTHIGIGYRMLKLD
ncbi:response regulator [Pectinatus sottacetonis]|uniref:response regulator n=1 Tax=Pectinatus sottacetonis TaxID=1002795 RepID=UPI0018C6C5C2|nr:response regulator transcription factor [Pectinatus sottacetonis]